MKRRRTASTTENRSSSSRGLDLLPTAAILRLMAREDARAAAAVRRALPSIARAVDAIVRAMETGGRLIYAGAGTSGRLAVLDAAECPPTFGVDRGTVRALIAGGNKALRVAAEGAEDSFEQGERDIAALRVRPRDTVVCLSASGETPYPRGAMRCARRRGTVTIGVTSNPGSPIARLAHIAIVLRTGPELIAGSTRLKAGTAQKLVLNMLSSASMIRLGRVYDNWMIDLALSNQKLRRRACRILEQAAGVGASAAAHALRKSGDNPRVALIMLKTHSTAAAARKRLGLAGGNLRLALGER